MNKQLIELLQIAALLRYADARHALSSYSADLLPVDGGTSTLSGSAVRRLRQLEANVQCEEARLDRWIRCRFLSEGVL